MSVPRGPAETVDYLIIGGGFYGCSLALFLRSVSDKVTVVEAGERILDRASRVNQARLHSGFHYPRSMLTALKSRMLCHRFARDFPEAVVDDFQMLYAVARQRSKISANRFLRMFENMKAPIRPATVSERSLFDPVAIEAAWRCDEYSFDYSVLARHLTARLDTLGVDLQMNETVEAITDVPVIDPYGPEGDPAVVHLASGRDIRARHVFNVTYAQINHLLRRSELPEARLKHELTEIVLVDPPPALQGYGVTVMDGPFFSAMPYPSAGKYSLTHVRYTPHLSWVDDARVPSPYALYERYGFESRAQHMIRASSRYMPCLGEIPGGRSIYDIKTVLMKNEMDDGRPILVHRPPVAVGLGSRVTSVLGGKIDNVYDLFQYLKSADPYLARADTRHLVMAPRTTEAFGLEV